MFFSVPAHVYLTYFNQDLVALDLMSDSYIILQPDDALRYENLLAKQVDKAKDWHKQKSSHIPDEQIAEFLSLGLIAETTEYQTITIPKHSSAGATHIDWRIPTDSLYRSVSFPLVLEAYYTLIRVNVGFGKKKFYRHIHALKRQVKAHKQYINPNKEQLLQLATAVDKACFFYPQKTKCLEWAICFVTMALRRQYRCNLTVGVQNIPFRAHAWVEANGQIFADDPQLPKQLAVILREPFKEVLT